MSMDSYENLDEATRKKIEELQKVTRESESDVKFSLAQIKLAEIFYKYGFFDEAVRVSNLIEPKDSYEHYQKAQYNIGTVYEEQGDTDAAIKIWSKMKEDSSEVYSRAQFNIGIILNDSGEFEDAKKAWGKVKRKGSPQTYAKAQFNIASRLFKEGKEDYAIRVWRNVEKDVYSEAYALAQFNIGVGLNRKGCIEDALDTWDNIEIENSLEIFNLAQYNIGTVSLENNTQSQYITRAENALKKIVNGYQYEKQCLEKICRLLKTSSTDVGKYLLLLFTHTTEIIKILKVDFSHRVTDNKPIERKLAHYTGTDTTNKLLDIEKGKEQPSSFRLNTINNVNDPSEGKLLLNYLKGVKGLSYNSQFDEDLHAFISCFTFNHDSLNQFRLYGKEGNKEASGISLVFKKDFFQKYYFIGGLSYVFFEDIPSSPKNTRNTAGISLREGKIEKQPVMRCVYIDPTSNYIHLAQRNRLTFFREFNDESVQIGSKTLSKAEYEWKSYKSFIDQKTEDFSIAFTDLQSDYRVIVKEVIEIEKVNPSLSSKIQVLLNEIILPLKYLIKHSAFQEEQECRMVYMTSLDDKKVKMEFGKFLYVEYEADVKSNLDKIYIAPAATQYQPYLAKLLCDTNVKIELSNNPYRQT